MEATIRFECKAGEIGPGKDEQKAVKNSAMLIGACALLLALPLSVQGQLTLNGGVVKTEALGGQWGGDVRLSLDPPGLPVGGYLGADYFLADCSGGCGLWGWRAGAIFQIGTPAVKPYITGAYVIRELERGGSVSHLEGMALGVGVRVNAGIRLFAEASQEFMGDELKGWFLRIGLGL